MLSFVGSSGGAVFNTYYAPSSIPYQPDENLYLASGSLHEIAGKSLKGLAQAIEASLAFLEKVLPPAEETRIKALIHTLNASGTALEAGSMDTSMAKAAVTTAFTVAFETGGGLVVSAIFAGVATYASSLAPMPPHAKAAMIAGSGVFGFFVDMAIGDAGLYDNLASGITNGLFAGAEALSNFLTDFSDAVSGYMNPFTRQRFEDFDYLSYNPAPDDGGTGGADPSWVNSDAFAGADSVTIDTRSGYGTGGGGTGPYVPIMPEAIIGTTDFF